LTKAAEDLKSSRALKDVTPSTQKVGLNMETSQALRILKDWMTGFVGRPVSYEQLAKIIGYKNGRSLQAVAEGKPVSQLGETSIRHLLDSLPSEDEKLWFPEFTFGENTLTDEDTMTIHRNWYPRFLGALVDPDMPVAWAEDYLPIDNEDRLAVYSWIDQPIDDECKKSALQKCVTFVVIEKQNIETGEFGS